MGKPVSNFGRAIGAGIHERGEGYVFPPFAKNPRIEIEKSKENVKYWKGAVKRAETTEQKKYCKIRLNYAKEQLQQALKEKK